MPVRMRNVMKSPRARARTGALLAVGLACALLSAGCGTASVGSAVDPVARAATISSAAAGYKMSLAMRIASPALPGAINATGVGSFTPASRTGTLTLSMDLSAIPGAAQALGGSSLEIRELVDGGTFYIKLPAVLAGRLPGAGQKPWLEFDLAKVAASAGIPGLSSLLNNPASSNPAQMLQYLRAVSGGVRRVGTEMIDGRTTTHYRARIDLQRYPSLAPPAQRAAARQAITALERLSKTTSFPVDVWIDAQHLVRRMGFVIRETAPSTGPSLQSAFRIDFTDYGPQAAPSFPPAGQVTNVSSLLAGHLG